MPDNAAALNKKLQEVHREGEEREARRIAEAAGLPYIDLRKTPIAIEAVGLLKEEDAKRAYIAALQLRAKELALAVLDPSSSETKTAVRGFEAQGYKVKLFVASRSGITQAWHFYEFVAHGGKEITGKLEISKERLQDLLRRLTTTAAAKDEIESIDFHVLAVTQLFEIVLAGALANRASDVHFEAHESGARLRFRIDGTLHDIFADIPLRTYESLVSRIKLLSGLKINVRSKPQDGRFTVRLTEKEVEMRVSIIPSEFGETVVMRILDPSAINITLDQLGLRKDDREIAERELKRPNGLLLNTGPTGSGKTTTLYVFLRHANNPDVKIITVEDPIEYHLPGIEQTQVDPDTKYTFASGLRSVLRQDPDVILVGEVRDKETAEIAMQAALTGHLVFSTLHTNDAVGAVLRLSDLGVKPPTIASALTLVIAQRLMRTLCAACKKPIAPTSDLGENIKAFLAQLPARVDRAPYGGRPTLFASAGCAVCNGIGYKGRVGVFEFLEMTPEFQELVGKDASELSLRKLARAQGMVSMQEDGILKALEGHTTLEEVEKVTGKLKWESS